MSPIFRRVYETSTEARLGSRFYSSSFQRVPKLLIEFSCCFFLMKVTCPNFTTLHILSLGKFDWTDPLSIFIPFVSILGRGLLNIGEREQYKISASANGGPRSRVCARETRHSTHIDTSGNFRRTCLQSNLQNFQKKTKKTYTRIP